MASEISSKEVLDGSFYSLLIEASPSNITPDTASVFTAWDASRQIPKFIWISRESLKKAGLNISAPLFKAAAMADDLMLVLLQTVQSNPAKAPELAKRLGGSLHFSAKQYDLPESIYVTEDFVAFGIKDSLIGDGGYARVKKARTLDGKIVARRISHKIVERKICDAAERMIATLQKFQGNPWIIDLLGVCKYKKLSGEYGTVTFHSLYPQNLFEVLEPRIKFEKIIQLELAGQLLKALQSLDGAHGDLKPENILVDLDNLKLVLIDLEFYRSNKETGEHIKGSLQWAAPECFLVDGAAITNKLDVWPAGLILYYLFLTPHYECFPWHGRSPWETLRFLREIKPDDMQKFLLKDPLSEHQKVLLCGMIEVDLEKRWTIDAAAAYFQEHIFPGKKAPMDDQKN